MQNSQPQQSQQQSQQSVPQLQQMQQSQSQQQSTAKMSPQQESPGPSSSTSPSPSNNSNTNNNNNDLSQPPIQQQRLSQSSSSESYLYSRLKSQVEFYFSSQNLSRDLYLRNLMGHYGGATVPLSLIASFPKVREIYASSVNTNQTQSNPVDLVIMMRTALEGSQRVKISNDGAWISPVGAVPRFDPSSVSHAQRHMNVMPMVNVGVNLNQQHQGQHMQQMQHPQHLQQQVQTSQSHQQGNMPTRFSMQRQISISSAPPLSTVRTSSPLSSASSGNGDPNTNTTSGTAVTSTVTIIVYGIPTDIAAEIIKSAFTTDSVIPKDAKPVTVVESSGNNNNDAAAEATTTKSKNTWHVTFATEQDATTALNAATDKTINGLPVRAKITSIEEGIGEADKPAQSQQQSQHPIPYPQHPNQHQHISHQSPNRHVAAVPPHMSLHQHSHQHSHQPLQYPSVSHMIPPTPQGIPSYPYTTAAYQHQSPFQYPTGGAGRYPHPSSAAPTHLQHSHPPHPSNPPPPSGHQHTAHPHHAAMQYPPQMYGRATTSTAAYAYMSPAGARPYYTPQSSTANPNQQPNPQQVYLGTTASGGPNLVRRPIMRKTKSDGSFTAGNGVGGGGKNQMRKSTKKKNGQNQQFSDNYGGTGGINPFLPQGQAQVQQRMNRGGGSREGLDNAGNIEFRKGRGKDGYGYGYGPTSQSRRKSNSPMLDAVDSYEGKSGTGGNRNRKKKSKRRGDGSDCDNRRKEQQQQQKETEIFDENIFPALSPAKSKQREKSSAVTNNASNGFSGYADALRQNNKPKPVVVVADTVTNDGSGGGADLGLDDSNGGNGKEAEPSAKIDEMLAKIKITPVNDSLVTKTMDSSEDSASFTAKPSPDVMVILEDDITSDKPTEQTREVTDNAANLTDSNELVPATSSNTPPKPILTKDEPTPKEASIVDVKPADETENVVVTPPEKKTVTDENKNEPLKTLVETETELNSASTGAWGSKRSFIDVVKRQS